MTATTITNGPCVVCGTETVREVATGMAEFLNRFPLRCETCADREASEAEAADRERERKEKDDLRARRCQNLHRNADVPAALQRIRVGDLDVTADRHAALQAASNMLSPDRPNVPTTLIGGVGRGKTSIATALCNSLLDQLVPMQWVSAPGLVARLDRPFGSPERDQALAVIDGKTSGLLLDDLDKVRATEHVSALLFAAIDSRITEGLPLIVTTNLKPSEIARRFKEPNGPAIASRLVGGIVVEVGGQDRRLRRTA